MTESISFLLRTDNDSTILFRIHCLIYKVVVEELRPVSLKYDVFRYNILGTPHRDAIESASCHRYLLP